MFTIHIIHLVVHLVSGIGDDIKLLNLGGYVSAISFFSSVKGVLCQQHTSYFLDLLDVGTYL